MAAEKLENLYLRSSLVAQVFVHGDSLHSVLVAVVVPSEDGARAWAKAAGKPSSALADLVVDAEFNKAVLDDIARVGREGKLQGFEIIKAVHLDAVAWSPESILTPSFKLKRTDAKKLYQKQVRAAPPRRLMHHPALHARAALACRHCRARGGRLGVATPLAPPSPYRPFPPLPLAPARLQLDAMYARVDAVAGRTDLKQGAVMQ